MFRTTITFLALLCIAQTTVAMEMEIVAPNQAITNELLSYLKIATLRAFPPKATSLPGHTHMNINDIHTLPITCIAIDPKGNHWVTGSQAPDSLNSTDPDALTETPENLILRSLSNQHEIQHPLSGHHGDVTCAAFNHDGTLIASGSSGKENNCFIWDTDNYIAPKHKISGYYHGIRAINFTPNGKHFIVGAQLPQTAKDKLDQTLKMYSSQTGACIRTFAGHPVVAHTFIMSNNHSTWISGGESNNAIVIRDKDGNVSSTVATEAGASVHSLALSPDNKTLISAEWSHSQHNFVIRNGADGTEQRCITSEWINAVQFSPDGSFLAAGELKEDNGTVLTIRDTASYKHPVSLPALYAINAIAFLDNNRMITGSGMGNIFIEKSEKPGYHEYLLLWDLFTPEALEIFNFVEHTLDIKQKQSLLDLFKTKFADKSGMSLTMSILQHANLFEALQPSVKKFVYELLGIVSYPHITDDYPQDQA